MTATVPMNAAEWGVGIEFAGNAMDIYYVAIPTAVLGPELTVYDCHQNVIDELTPIGHWNPPLLTPLTMTFNVGVATGLYGWKGIDLGNV